MTLSSLIRRGGVRVVELIALTPGADLLPLTEGGITLREVLHDTLLSVSPYAGKQAAVSAALLVQVGHELPPVQRRAGPLQWFGHQTWMVAQDVALDGLAAVTDQSDAWATVAITGQGVGDVLARLVPIDLRAKTFETNHVAKTMLGHMSVTLTRVGPETIEIVVMRSMAQTLVHELHIAIKGVAARQVGMPPAEV